jgi:hypothetical protein
MSLNFDLDWQLLKDINEHKRIDTKNKKYKNHKELLGLYHELLKTKTFNNDQEFLNLTKNQQEFMVFLFNK